MSSKAPLYIFIGISAFITIAIVVTFFVVWLPMKSYISEKPYVIDHVPVSTAAEDSIESKVHEFYRNTEKDSLIVNAVELNHLLRTNDRLKEYGVDYRLRISDGLINIRCSVPVKTVKNQMASVIRYLNLDGYINAEIEGNVILKDGQILVASTRAQLNGKQAPYGMLGKRTHIDLFDFVKDKKEYLESVKSLKQLSIVGDQIIVVRK